MNGSRSERGLGRQTSDSDDDVVSVELLVGGQLELGGVDEVPVDEDLPLGLALPDQQVRLPVLPVVHSGGGSAAVEGKERVRLRGGKKVYESRSLLNSLDVREVVVPHDSDGDEPCRQGHEEMARLVVELSVVLPDSEAVPSRLHSDTESLMSISNSSAG